MRLTDITIRSLKPPERGAKTYPCDQLKGFGVRVSQAGTASYVLTYGPQRERITIGRVGVVTLKDARAEAKRLLAEHTLGKHRPKRISFEDALTLFVAEKKQKNRARTISENERILRKYWKSLHRKQLTEIRTEHITKVLDRLSGTPGTALHSFWTLRTFLRWCLKRRYLQYNPIDALDPPSAVTFRERVLTSAEIRKILVTAPTQGTFGKLVLMCLYTGARRTEVANMRADWFGNGICVLPSWICKNRREHRFPYDALVCELLATLPEEGLLFPSSRGTPWSNFSKAKLTFDKAAGLSNWVLHDCRRTLATFLQPHYRKEVVEALLNHVSGERSGITGVYQRHHWHDEMRAAMLTWQRHLQQLLDV